MSTDAIFNRYANPEAKAAVAKQHRKRRRDNRRTYDAFVKELKDLIDQGLSVEIQSGPCAPMVVKDAESLRIYAHKLWAWITA